MTSIARLVATGTMMLSLSVSGCTDNPDLPSTSSPPASGSEVASSRASASPTPATGSRAHSKTVKVPVYYLNPGDRLVARIARIPARGDRFESALAAAATPPAGSDLRPAFPSDAFAGVSFDGFGTHSQVGVMLASPSFTSAQPGQSTAQARLAIRAAACTAQLGTDSPVVFYVDHRHASRLFGQRLRGGTVADADCPR